ncbi:MAG: bifunctional alpha,alpha-trehalose-phosphate synthase (UDP-forming)/trehalose-phosphatase [Lewinella sp.]|nr:bifunctional alpha,alpha-trehalose-phosphate synthase (UDP-forming)/trehalose-phosphatase [Lewinella sp.]
MSRIVIISNRLPVTVDRQEGELHFHPSAGGLATGLNSLDDSFEKIWIGWPGQDIRGEWEQAAVRETLAEDGLVPVFLSEEEIKLYYEGFSNKVVWPHFHYFTQHTTYREAYWESYRAVNEKFAQAVLPILREDDLVWVHDYQLMLLPRLIRNAFPRMSVGFFLHIPFPSYEVFRILPWREAILDGLLGADQIGFHTFGYMRHFLSAAYRISGYEHHFGQLTVENRIVNVDVFPMGIDYDKYAFPDINVYEDDGSFQIKQLAKNRKLVISIDRLDYTKGIPQRLRGFHQFLTEYPEWRRKVVLVMIVVPSRANVDQYKELKEEEERLVSRLNGEFGTFDWSPVQYFYRSLNFGELTTLYQEADVALITPLRDGMNLVAKEYIASKETRKTGVLVLSEMAGASSELTEALSVNPQDRNMIAEQLHVALTMNEKEQRWRLETMQEKLKKSNVRQWAATFINEQKRLMQTNQQKRTTRLLDKTPVLDAYQAAKERLIVLDYDGTLMGFDPDPQAVAPDPPLLQLLDGLVADQKNKVVINSGRDKQTLENWLGHLPIEMAAEHGVWIKKDGKWTLHPNVTNNWKEEIRGVLEDLVERTPGSFIEEKDYSLAWHYRRIERDLGEKRVREFRDVLLYLTSNLDLQVLEGNKVVEIKNAGVNKGNATQMWVKQQDWDFLLALGDDHTDEDIFRAMPEKAFTIKVGLERSEARFSLVSVADVRELLESLR